MDFMLRNGRMVQLANDGAPIFWYVRLGAEPWCDRRGNVRRFKTPRNALARAQRVLGHEPWPKSDATT